MRALLLKTAVSFIIILGLGGGTAALASDSQPDSPLYPVKLMMEDARLAMSNGPANQGAQQLRMAQERVQEMTQAALDGDPLHTQTMARLQTHLDQALHLAAQSPEAETGHLLNQMQEMLQVQTATMAQVQGEAGLGSQKMLGELNRTLNQYQEQVQAALQDPQTFRQQYGQDADFEPPAGAQNQHGQDADAPGGPNGPGDGDCGEDCEPAGPQHQHGSDQETTNEPYGPGAAGDPPEDNENHFGQDGDGSYGPGYGQDSDAPYPGPGNCEGGGCGSQDNHHNNGAENGGGDNSNGQHPTHNGGNGKGG